MLLAKNKQSYFNYEILEKFEAGIQLQGWEVKSIRAGMVSFNDSYVKITDNGVFVLNMHISRWRTQSPSIQIDESRPKRLLLKKSEISKLRKYKQSPGISIIVLDIHLRNNKVKLEIGIGKGRKKFDKREYIKAKEMKRDITRRGNRW